MLPKYHKSHITTALPIQRIPSLPISETNKNQKKKKHQIHKTVVKQNINVYIAPSKPINAGQKPSKTKLLGKKEQNKNKLSTKPKQRETKLHTQCHR